MTLVLHDHPWSSNALKVRFLLEVLGLPYRRRHVPFAQPRPEWHRQRQPFGAIPCLIDGELAVGESNTILRYLATRQGRDDLYPVAAPARAAVDWAMDAWSTQVRPAFLAIEDVTIFADDDLDEEGGGAAKAGNLAAAEGLMGALAAALDGWEALIGGGDTTITSRFTIADCCCAPILHRSLRLPIDLERWPRTHRLRAALLADPHFLAADPRG